MLIVLKKTLFIILVIFFSVTTTYGQSVLFSIAGVTNAGQTGHSIAIVGDINSDGFPDVLVGEPQHTENNLIFQPGRARIISGRDGSIVRVHLGATFRGRFGQRVSQAGDYNSDGISDYVIAEDGFPNVGALDGAVRVYSGSDGSVLATFTSSLVEILAFGLNLAGGCDINNDGISDFIFSYHHTSTSGGTFAGGIRVIAGGSGAVIHNLVGLPGSSMGVGFARNIACVPDVNGDGFDDFLVGMPGVNSGTGQARLYSGQNTSILYTWSGSFSPELFGYFVASVGDVNADGIPDVSVSSNNSNIGPDIGKVYLYSGANGSLIRNYTGSAGELNFGYSVAGIGDMNADGNADIAIGVPGQNLIQIKSGSAGSHLFTISGASGSPGFGYEIAGGIDVNGDSFPDIVASSIQNGPFTGLPGYVRVIAGPPALSRYPLVAVAPNCSGANLSASYQALAGGISFGFTDASAPNSTGLLVLGPQQLGAPIYIGATCPTYLDQASLQASTVIPFTTDSAGNWTTLLPVPANTTGLHGLQMTAQVVVLPASGFVLSNPIVVTVQ